jgi:hypothetical protein
LRFEARPFEVVTLRVEFDQGALVVGRAGGCILGWLRRTAGWRRG